GAARCRARAERLTGAHQLRSGFRRPAGQALVAAVTATFERRSVGRDDSPASTSARQLPQARKAGTALMTATGRQALQLTRAGYGAALLLAPVLTIRLATGNLPSRRTCQVARLLGARHLAQATLTALAPLPGAFVVGAGADAVHAGSMLILATA